MDLNPKQHVHGISMIIVMYVMYKTVSYMMLYDYLYGPV